MESAINFKDGFNNERHMTMKEIIETLIRIEMENSRLKKGSFEIATNDGNKKNLNIDEIIDLLNDTQKENIFFKKMIERLLNEKKEQEINNSKEIISNELLQKAQNIIENKFEEKNEEYIYYLISLLKEKDKKINNLKSQNTTNVQQKQQTNNLLQIDKGNCFMNPVITYDDISD